MFGHLVPRATLAAGRTFIERYYKQCYSRTAPAPTPPRHTPVPADWPQQLRQIRADLALTQTQLAPADRGGGESRHLSVGISQATAVPRVLGRGLTSSGPTPTPLAVRRAMPRHDPDRSQRSPAQCTVDDGLDRPFVGQGDDTDGGPPPRSRGGSPRARRPARRALVVLEGGVPRRPVTSSRRHTRACAGGRRGRPARCGGGSPDSAGGSRALPRACGDGGVDGSTPRRGPRVPDNRRCRTSRYGSSRTTSVPVSRTRTGNGSSAARTPARCIGSPDPSDG